jgi:hypothetical protein
MSTLPYSTTTTTCNTQHQHPIVTSCNTKTQSIDQFGIPMRVLEEEKGSWELGGGGREGRKEGL